MCLFARDEVCAWLGARGKPWSAAEPGFRAFVQTNIDHVIRKAEALGCKAERESVSHFHMLLLSG